MNGKFMNLITYPTEFGKKRIVCYNKQQLNKLINQYNGQTACFATVYTSLEVYPLPVINKAFFDFDKEDKLQCEKTLHNRLLDDDIIHYMQMSGKGFHLFAFTKSYDEGDSTHRKSKLKSFQKKYAGDLTYDKKIFGDIARLFRIPNTWNCSAGRYCIPITEEILDWKLEDIYEYAKEPRYEFKTYGTKLADLHDIEIIEEEERPQIDITFEDINDDFIQTVLPCTRYIMNTIHPTHDQKVAMVADLKFRLTLGQKCDIDKVGKNIEDIIWKYCKWSDLNSIIETRRQIKSVLNGIDFGYGCFTKKNDFNMCVKGCNLYKEEKFS